MGTDYPSVSDDSRAAADTDPYQSLLNDSTLLILLSIAVSVLSVGVGAAMILFVYLAFAFPNAASIAVPLILSPVTTLIILHRNDLANAIKSNRGFTAQSSPQGVPGDGIIKLGSDLQEPCGADARASERRKSAGTGGDHLS